MARGSASRKTALAGEQERPGIARKRARRKARPGSIDLKQLGFIDETRDRTDMAPLRGRAARGRRLTGRAPFVHRNTMAFIAALRQDGIVPPRVIDGSINGEAFRTRVEQVPVPALRPPYARPAPGRHRHSGQSRKP